MENDEITMKALKLKELNEKAMEALSSNDLNKFLINYYNFLNIKQELRENLHDFGIITINNQVARSIINELSINESFEVENIYNKLEEISGIKGEEPGFYFNLFEKANQWFHDNYDVLKIWVRRYSLGPIALKLTKHKFIDKYIKEAFDCYSFGNYNALSSMCRTIIEAAIIDICLYNEIVKKESPGARFYINKLTEKGSPLNKKIWEIYDKASKVVHGTKVTRNDEFAKDLLNNTIKIIQDLYEVHGIL